MRVVILLAHEANVVNWVALKSTRYAEVSTVSDGSWGSGSAESPWALPKLEYANPIGRHPIVNEGMVVKHMAKYIFMFFRANDRFFLRFPSPTCLASSVVLLEGDFSSGGAASKAG